MNERSVWVLTEGYDYEGEEVLGVFSTRQKAENAVKVKYFFGKEQSGWKKIEGGECGYYHLRVKGGFFNIIEHEIDSVSRENSS